MPFSLYTNAMIFTGMVCIALLGLDLEQTWVAHDVRLQEAKTETDNIVRSVAQHVQDIFETTDAELRGLQQAPGVGGRDPAVLMLLEQRMRMRVANQRLFHGQALLDEHGEPIVTTLDRTHPGLEHIPNYTDRKFFQYHREHADDDALVGPPVRAKDDGTWVVTLSRRLDHPDGSFAGVATASIAIDLFQRFIESFDVGKRGGIALESAKGIMIARIPFEERNVGRDVSKGDFFKQLPRDATAGNIDFASGFDAGARRLGSFRRVSGFDLIAVAALNKNEVLAGWWRETQVHLLCLAITACCVIVLGFRLKLQIRDRVAAEAVTKKLQLEESRRRTDEVERRAYERGLEKSNTELDHLAGELTLALDAAEQASRAKSRFLAGMNHELRTPLNGILGYARLLKVEGGLNVAQSARIESMLRAGTHLLEVIHRVLDLAEIETGRIEVRKAEVDLRGLANAALDIVRPQAEEKHLALGLSVAPDVPALVTADATRLRQILVNLLGNAVKFTSRGAVQLGIRIAADPDMLRFEVADTGPGVANELRGHLFKDFQRLETEASRATEGAGLGLSLSAQLAALMDGRVGYDDNPAGGSVFWLELPLLPKGGTQPRRDLEREADRAGAKASSPCALDVLVVDDFAMNREIAASFLRFSGHRVTCAEGGAEAVAAVSATAFDVVLMDVRMPDVDGLEATRRIRALQGPHGQVPIVALTAQAFTEQVAACRKAGMDTHLAKPFDPDMLLATVLRVAGKGPAKAIG
jgi:signal transduction histidine kinase/CheY-like chemotaxis protein